MTYLASQEVCFLNSFQGSEEDMIATPEAKDKKKGHDMNRGNNAAQKRFGKLELDELRNQREELEMLVEKFRQMETVITAFQFENEKIRVDGITKFQRATDELFTYIENVKKGVIVHKHGEIY
jgi:hypothetical protein